MSSFSFDVRHGVAVLGVAAGVLAAACSGGGDDGSSSGGSGTSGGSTSGDPGGKKACLLNNCKNDAQCKDCGGGATKCATKEKRCVACGPLAGGQACAAGQSCTKSGACVPAGKTCAAAEDGTPTITCNADADCAACDPEFRTCDPSTKKCAQCTDTNKTNCQTTDVCSKGACVAKCPDTCNADADCTFCAEKGKKAPVCNRGKCGQCNDDKKCGDAQVCDSHGVCVKSCGIDVSGRGVSTKTPLCRKDTDCAACASTPSCKIPLNGGIGECVVKATGCSDLGAGIVTLPAPFDKVTNTCSKDEDCKDVSVDFNVGKAIKDLTGIGAIGDASIKYGMNACASVKVSGTNLKCGVCVPCREDVDCKDINVLELAGQAFGPLGSIGAALLLDEVFGPNDNKLHMYCQKVGSEFGACVPCANPLARCAQTKGDTTASDCSHDVCTIGEALSDATSCQAGCAAEVCAEDPFCCSDAWDFRCKQLVPLFCTKKTCEPRSCNGKSAGWYCNEEPGRDKEAYECKGENATFNGVSPCKTTCQRKVPGDIRSQAVVGGDGKPTCL
jgi:hypothetical protein